jgi:hypothetical protein
MLVAVLRVWDGSVTRFPDAEPPVHSSFVLLGVCAIAAGCGLLLRHPLLRGKRGAAWCGVAVALLPPLLSRATGETVSLSTLDVRLAIAAADTAFGLPAAVLIAALRPHLPALCLLAMLAPALALVNRTEPARFNAFAAGLAAALIGQTFVAGALLSYLFFLPTFASLAFSLLARQIGEIAVPFLVVALAVRLGNRNAMEQRAEAGGAHHSSPGSADIG